MQIVSYALLSFIVMIAVAIKCISIKIKLVSRIILDLYEKMPVNDINEQLVKYN